VENHQLSTWLDVVIMVPNRNKIDIDIDFENCEQEKEQA